MSSLFEIGAELEAIKALLEEQQAEDAPNEGAIQLLTEWFADAEANLGEKIDKYTLLIFLFEKDADALTAFLGAMRKRKKSIEKSVALLRSRLAQVMDALQLKKVRRPRQTVTLRYTKPEIEVLDIQQVPESFLDFELSLSIPLEDLIHQCPEVRSFVRFEKSVNQERVVQAGVEVPGIRVHDRQPFVVITR